MLEVLSNMPLCHEAYISCNTAMTFIKNYGIFTNYSQINDIKRVLCDGDEDLGMFPLPKGNVPSSQHNVTKQTAEN